MGNYFRICHHPLGGYAAVEGEMSNLQDGFEAKPTEDHLRFLCWEDAYASIRRVPEHGIHIDPDLLNEDRVRILTRTYPEEVAVILRDMGYGVEAPVE